MSKTKPQAPLTIGVRDYAMREAAKEIAALGSSELHPTSRCMTSISDRIRDQIGQQIMSGTRKAYIFTNGKPELVAADAVPRHDLIAKLAAWLDGNRRTDRWSNSYNEITRSSDSRNISVIINSEWIAGLHIEDADLAADLLAAKSRIVELEAKLTSLDTGGISVEGKEAPELQAAISLYRAVASKSLPAGMTPAKALADRAEEFCKGLKAGAAARLAIVCNWDKAAGNKKKK